MQDLRGGTAGHIIQKHIDVGVVECCEDLGLDWVEVAQAPVDLCKMRRGGGR